MEKDRYLGIITKDVISATEEASAVEIARLIKEHQIGSVVIVRGDQVVGIVTERDLVTRVMSEGISPEQIKVKDFMTKDIVAVDFKEGLNKIYQKLCEINFRHLIILDGSKLVGITSRRDLLDALACKRR